jgi:hypothetical protein
MEELVNLSLIDQAITLVAPRKSGKTHLFSYLLFETLKKLDHSCDVIFVMIYCKSLIDANYFYKLYIYTVLDSKLLKPNQDGIDFINKFELKEHIQPKIVPLLVKPESDYIIKTVLNKFIEYIISSNIYTTTIDKPTLFPSSFYFDGSISPSNLKKICEYDIVVNKKRKTILVIDDVDSIIYKPIQKYTQYIYEQGRHHDMSVVIIDQYIKSRKVPPETRLTSSYIMFRTFDNTIKKEICEVCSFDPKTLDTDSIKSIIDDKAAVIVDLNDKSKLYYTKAPSNPFQF